MRRGIVVGVAAVAAVGIGAGVVLGLQPGKKEPVQFETAAVKRGRLAAWVTATGTVSPRVTVQVGSQVSGRILEMLADFNSRVTKGQLIARIDPQLFATEVAQARANLVSAQAGVKGAEAQLADSKRQFERSSSLAERKLVAQAEADSALAAMQSAEANLASNKAKLEQARAALERAQTNLAYTKIVSPIDGVVISRDVDVGQTVAASLQAPTLFTIAEDLRKMEVHTSVAESDVGRLAPEMKVEFTVDAFPGERFGGVVKEVRYSPTTVQNVVTYDAVVSVENPELKLRPGMTADVSFLIEEQADVLMVPNAALRFRPPEEFLAQARAQLERGGAGAASAGDAPAERRTERAAGGGGKRPLWRLGPDGKPQAVRVDLGISDGRNTAVSGPGLKEGDLMIVGTLSGDEPAPAARPMQRGRFL
ncbi:MAG TPA: efflux RND transporter periplasmic adaptor subunit [Myxococcales bacterium]|jgi:HlyD family secretion protein|nr:efflux RND transporter periplasmic adaptor subunit [Myxococcales bacterium]